MTAERQAAVIVGLWSLPPLSKGLGLLRCEWRVRCRPEEAARSQMHWGQAVGTPALCGVAANRRPVNAVVLGKAGMVEAGRPWSGSWLELLPRWMLGKIMHPGAGPVARAVGALCP